MNTISSQPKSLKTELVNFSSLSLKRFFVWRPLRRLMILVVFVSTTGLLSAQKRPSDALFNQLVDQKGITSMSFSQSMIEMIDMDVGDEASDEKKVTGPLKEIKMTICKDAEAPGWSKKIVNFMERRPFAEVEDDDNDEDECRIFVKRKGNKVSACHVLFEGDSTLVMLSFFGDFKVHDLKQLSEKARAMKE